MSINDAFESENVRSARRVSEISVAWTVCASTVAVVVGARSGGLVLVAFGAVGYVDAIGSIALVHHFRRALRNSELEDRFERRAHGIVAIGLLCVGAATIVASAERLVAGAEPDPSFASVLVAALSVVVLVILAVRKRQLARQVPSAALGSDSHLSAIGAMQALVALLGIVATRAFSWAWADAVAALGLGVVAMVLGWRSWRELAT
jgi:divalent metal cation (Fe/Co/Zn/Cd) transporter